MPYNLDIAGQMSEEELACIERMAASVPPGGRVVELGSLFGRSSWAWAKSVDPTVTVYCVDPWRRENWIAQFEQKFGITFGIETFHHNTADCINIVALPGYSPEDVGDWNLPVDLYFDDSVHANPTFRGNLEFWMRHVRPGGIMSGHDYRPEFPDVVTEVRALAERFGTTARIVGSIWSVQLPDGDRQSTTPQNKPSALDLLQSADNADAPQLPHKIGSMMKPEELHLLYALAKHHYCGVGEVIDLGPFLGSSTFMLVEGLLANTVSRRREPRVFSFDRFIYEPHKGYDAFLRAEDLPTSSFFPHFATNLGHRIQNVYCSPGDLLQLRWNQHPIEILFIDAAKTSELNDHIVRQFFGALDERHAVVVQQDYFYYGCPWIILAMEHFSDWITYSGSAPGATAWFQSRARIPAIVLRTPVEVANNAGRLVHLLERAAERQASSNRRMIVLLGLAYHLARNGHGDRAAAIVNALRPPAVHDEWAAAAEWNLTALRQELHL